MTKDVLVKIIGRQNLNDGEDDTMEIVTTGSYYKKKNHHFLLYDELIDGSGDVVKNVVKFDKDMFSLTKSGFTNVNMLFEKDKRNITNYITPYGSMVVGVGASDINIDERDKDISIDIKYSLDVNYEFLADCSLHMDILSK